MKNTLSIDTSSNGNPHADHAATDKYMALLAYPTSGAAISFVDAVTGQVAAAMGCRPLKKLKDPVGAILGDLLKAAKNDPATWSYRPVGSGEFVKSPIGYKPFIHARDGLQRLKMVDTNLGLFRSDGSGHASRFRAKTDLLDMANQHGILLGDWAKHFANRRRSAIITRPIMLRASREAFRGEKKKKNIKIDWTIAEVLALKGQVDRINKFFAGVEIEGGEHHGFRRIFSDGNDPAFGWNMGGRLYSLGGGYQSMKSAERTAIRLDGQPVVEIDIKASHLTIIQALLGQKSNRVDPYDVPHIPRAVVKSWVTMALGYEKFQQTWSKGAMKKYCEDTGRSLEADYPLLETRELLMSHLPEVGEALAKGIAWAKLQFIESCAVIDTVHDLACVDGIPALPVHDSIIVPACFEDHAKAVLSAHFHRHTGVIPTLEVKTSSAMPKAA